MLISGVRRGAWLGSGRQAGLSLVELMVGVAIGLFVVAGATVAVSNQLGDNRRLMLETQVQQDLRAAADLIARDLRRAGYWGAAETGVWNASAVSVATNPYIEMSAATVSGPAASAVTFAYSRGIGENNFIDPADQSGFRLTNAGVIEMRTGGGWQALTDSNTVRVTNFQVKLETTDVALACFNLCAGAPNCPPTQSVRDFEIVIDATAVHDPSVKRSVRSMARLRNDVVVGACPA
jgi:prepilin peptidase dependent protein B